MQADGAVINSVTNRGYQLVSPPQVPRVEYVRAHLTHAVPVFYEASVTSTNDTARAAAQKLPVGVFIAGEQTAGKGRKGRTWVSAPGNGVYMSFLVRPKTEPSEVAGLTLAAAMSLCHAIESTADVQTRIKWPNDVLIGNKKAAGILTESMLHMDGVDFVVCGIGVNTCARFEGELAGIACGVPANGTLLAAAMIDRFFDAFDLFEKHGLAPFMPEFRQRSALSGTVTVSSSGGSETGTLLGFDDNGALLLNHDGQTRRFVAGEVTLRGENGYV